MTPALSGGRRLRVLHVMPSIASRYGGPTQSLRGYLAASRTVGIQVAVAAPECSAADAAVIAAELQPSALHLFPTMFRHAGVVSPALWRWLWLHVTDFDIIHVHGLLNPVSSGAARLALWKRMPLVVRPFGTMSRYTIAHRRTALKKVYRRLVDAPNVRRASAIHFTSLGEQEEASWRGIDVHTMGHVVPTPYVGPTHVAEELPSKREVALFIGRLNPIKNLEALIDAWVMVVRSMPHARLVIAGDGEPSYRRQLAERVGSRMLEDRISLQGFVSETEKAPLFREASLFVLPSHHENFGVAALEAVAHGLPVVCSTEVQLAPQLVQAGLGLAAPGHPAELAEALLSVLRDDAMRAYCASAGPCFIQSTFSTHIIGQQLENMYNSALERSARIGSA